VWARKDIHTVTCPKCIVTPESKQTVELFSVLKHLRVPVDPERHGAKEIDGLVILETEYQKELNHGAR